METAKTPSKMLDSLSASAITRVINWRFDMRITVASGKGGTGKTTFSVNLAYFLAAEGKKVALLDGDVEEPNDHLFMPECEMGEESVSVLKPVLNAEKCVGCGKCVEACGYNALALARGNLIIFNELCHSCGACSYVCPTKALTEKETNIGKVFHSEPIDERPFKFAYGVLNIGEALAPKVVKELKEQEVADAVNILDAAPGTACPVVEALGGDLVSVLVTEPTPFGLNDLKLAAELSLDLGNPTGIVINRSDGDDAIIADFAEERGIPILGRIPFDRKYAETYSRGEILVERHPELNAVFAEIFAKIAELEESEPAAKFAVESPKVDDGKNGIKFPSGDADDYREVVVLSGKGGTGKTTVASSLAKLADDKVLFDADVDAADLHLLLKPEVLTSEEFSGSDEYMVEPSKCCGCGRCAALCHFDAINLDGPGNDIIGMTYRIDPLACEGCGLCEICCPVDAITAKPAHTGDWFVSKAAEAPMAHAKLGVGAENSGKLVSKVRNEAANLAKKFKRSHIIGDGPPGTGCPVIASITGADLALLVTEPTVSGEHDLARVMELLTHFAVKTLVVVNKADLNDEITERIRSTCRKNGVKVIGEIPFDRNVHEALMLGRTIVEYGKGEAAAEVSALWERVKIEL